MKKILAIATLCCLFLATNVASAGDTGTYKIAEYDVKLTPRSNGKVDIEYHQKWTVTGGHIPWITVGLANENFQIVPQKTKGAVKKIKSDSSGDWSGVKIDLDKDYKPGESFDVWFGVVQSKLFYADKDNYRLDFTPGWYDRAETGKLKIEVFFFAKIDKVQAKPKPSRTEGQSMIWEKANLKKGEKFEISVSFPKKLFPKEIAKSELKSGLTTGAIILICVIGGLFLLVLIGMVVSELSGDGYGGGGGVYYGGGGGRSYGGGGGRGYGGGGGFGGRSSSCACACVSCACACACAGGGGAGCDRKLTRRCPLCRDCSKKETCPLWAGGDQ